MTPPDEAATASAAATVPSCHQAVSDTTAYPGAPIIALVGSPNTGKSSLFNALTGIRRDVGNWPGTTVEVGRGTTTLTSGTASDPALAVVLDFPGAYGLDPVSPTKH